VVRSVGAHSGCGGGTYVAPGTAHFTRVAFARPYVLMCLVFTGASCYSFAALGDLGLITQEAAVTMPFFFVLLCIP
jgi:hypothetical protein